MRARQTLIFDADDTLWENNIYFEAAFDHFCEYLSHSSMKPPQIRFILDEIERTNSQIHGYGSLNFARNLAECYRHLAERDISPADLEAVHEFAHAILERPLELIEGVNETVAALAERHSLMLFTKGDPVEQQTKVDRSGLHCYFEHVAIVKEKNEPAYRLLTKDCGFDPDATWMIGNSPKSDINPALNAGLNAVFIPHAHTWALEHDEVPTGHPRLLEVEKIRELTQYF